jgi:hypothetical protein
MTMKKFFVIVLIVFSSLIGWNPAQAFSYQEEPVVLQVGSQKYLAACAKMGIDPNGGSVIIDPYFWASNDPSSWGWYVLDDAAGGGTRVRAFLFTFGWLPNATQVTVEYLGEGSEDQIFATGFESMDLPGGGLFGSSIWFGGPPDWQTSAEVVILTRPGKYRFFTEVYGNDGRYMFLRHLVPITAP